MNLKKIFLGSSLAFGLGAGIYLNKYNKLSKVDKTVDKKKFITRKQISEHYTAEKRIWVTYKDGVYDITDFVKVHPGGEEKIMLAAGGSIDPFWEMYSFHKKDDLYTLLEKYKIGQLDPSEVIDPKDLPNFDFLKKEELWRSPHLKSLQSFPYCAEAYGQRLIKNFYTPIEDFFVRNHFAVPIYSEDDVQEYSIELINKDEHNTTTLYLNSIEDIFGSINVDTIMTCTGNRRTGFNKYKQTKGLLWTVGAMSNGSWSGVPVAKILNSLGYNKENSNGKHLIVTGNDKDFQGVNFCISIPLEHAIDPSNSVILATKYNNEKIVNEHGYPLRFIVPGFCGVRNVKWVKSMKISDSEATSSYQKKDYKVVKGVNWEDFDKVDLSKFPSIMDVVPISVFVSPKDGETITIPSESENSTIEFSGYANGKSGAKVEKVEISVDNGNTWERVSEIDERNNSTNKKKYFGWVLWKHKKQFNKNSNITAEVRVTDSNGNSQYNNLEDLWNPRGLLNNSIDKINIKLL
jgi:sulfite oxidase